jgi:membrane dipeptidase
MRLLPASAFAALQLAALAPFAPLAGQTAAAPAAPASTSRTDPNLARAERVLRTTPLVDGHNDLPWAIRESKTAPGDVAAYDLRRTTPGHTDFARMRQGMLGAQFWSVYIPGEVGDATYAPNGEVVSAPGYARVQLEEIDIARRMIARYPDRLTPALRAADVAPAFRAGRVASFMGMEGGHAIENSLGTLRAFYDLGARYMTLTHNVTLDWADAALDSARHGGLTPFGEEVVREMNRLGMVVDLSHVSPGTMGDALRVTAAPVIFSHSSARALADHPRNVPDSILRLLPKNGGVVMVTFVPGFVAPPVVAYEREATEAIRAIRARYGADTAAGGAAARAWQSAHPRPRATLAQVADHIEHVRRVAGVNHVGIGSDFDGVSELPVGLEDVSKYPALIAELARRGWSDADLRKVAGENVLRALRQAEQVAARLQRERGPSTKTIAELDGRRAQP